MIVEGVIQETAEWVKARIGCHTASRQPDVMAKRKDMKEAAPRYNYKMELVIEHLTGRAADHYVSVPMQWGIDTQPMACAAYEIEKDVMADPGGFWLHDKIKFFGASPDYLIAEDGLVEVKCPTTPEHLECLTHKVIPQEYVWQMLAQMACTNRQWCDFVSYDPRLPSNLQLFIKRLERDEKLIAALECEVTQFLAEVEATVNKLRGCESGS